MSIVYVILRVIFPLIVAWQVMRVWVHRLVSWNPLQAVEDCSMLKSCTLIVAVTVFHSHSCLSSFLLGFSFCGCMPAGVCSGRSTHNPAVCCHCLSTWSQFCWNRNITACKDTVIIVSRELTTKGSFSTRLHLGGIDHAFPGVDQSILGRLVVLEPRKYGYFDPT